MAAREQSWLCTEISVLEGRCCRNICSQVSPWTEMCLVAPRDITGDAWPGLVCLDDFSLSVAKFLTSWYPLGSHWVRPLCTVGWYFFNGITLQKKTASLSSWRGSCIRLIFLLQRCPLEMQRGFLGTTSWCPGWSPANWTSLQQLIDLL